MVEICPLACGVSRIGIRFIRPERLVNCPRISSPDRNHLRAVRPRGISSESYSHLSRAEYPMRPSPAKSPPQRQARILVAQPNRQGMAACAAFARNTFRIRTYEKMGVGVASPSPWQNPHSAAKQCIINTYAKPAAKYSRMCTYKKNGGGGYPSPRFRYVA
jgi:hypothetical protein